MKRFALTFFAATVATGYAAAQTPKRTSPAARPTRQATVKAVKPAKTAAVQADVSEAPRRYKSVDYGFEIILPAGWALVNADFEKAAREQGLDLSLKAPESLAPVARVTVNKALRDVELLATAVRPAVDTAAGGAVLRISAENLAARPEIRDAVDYFDLMRSQFAAMRLPPDFRYSETQAEQLGPRQYGFIEIETSSGKKRLYATVRRRKAIVFALSYSSPAELAAFRQSLAAADFNVK